MNPVNKAEVPDYFDVVKEPMCWTYIDEKLEKMDYGNLAEFKVNTSHSMFPVINLPTLQRDVLLVLDNAMLYNRPDSPYHRTAARIKKGALIELEKLEVIPHPNESDQAGDLEPSIAQLRALSTLTGDDDPNRDILASIFAFEMEKPKPLPTPPPVKQKLSATERKRIKAEQAKARERLPGGRSTRAAEALVKAFEQEAGVTSPAATPQAGESRSSRTRAAPSTVDVHTDRESTPSEGGVRPMSKPQRGVVGLETLAVFSDKERRERERQLDIIAQDVDPKDQFARFNVGWVLPEGSKRRRAERPVLTPGKCAADLSLNQLILRSSSEVCDDTD